MKAENVLLGKRIRDARESRGWNKADLARRSGVAPSYVTRIEAGKFGRPSVDQIRAIATALGQSVTDLTDGREESLPDDLIAGITDLARGNEGALRDWMTELRTYPVDLRAGALRFMIDSLRAVRNLPVNRA